jgi:hypothetical protein
MAEDKQERGGARARRTFCVIVSKFCGVILLSSDLSAFCDLSSSGLSTAELPTLKAVPVLCSTGSGPP